ncbi:MAG: ribonuclease domain-containing protein [Pirellulaceae bacterium]
MPIRDRIMWGQVNPFSDPRLATFDFLVREIRLFRRLPPGVTGGSVFENRLGDLPAKPYGYYREYDVERPGAAGRGKLRFVLGAGGEVYITGNHYRDFRQVVDMPE